MIRPPQSDVTISGIAAWIEWNVPVRLTAMIFSHASAVICAKGALNSIPALVTMIEIGPSVDRTVYRRPARSPPTRLRWRRRRGRP